jgi:hypothetical protein
VWRRVRSGVTRWFFAVAVFPLLWATLWAAGALGSLDVAHVSAGALLAVLLYLTQPVWIWRLAHASDGYERRGRLMLDAPAVLLPPAIASALAWAWTRLSGAGGPEATVAIARLPGQEWRLTYLAVPFLVVLFGWGFAMLREDRTPLTASAALALPLSAPLLWLVLCRPATA